MAGRTLSFFAVFVSFMMLQICSSAAEGALAIGLPDRGPSGGFVYGMSVNNDEARTNALNLCRGITKEGNAIPDRANEAQSSCKIVGTFTNRCAAAAHNGTKHSAATGVGWSISRDSATAKEEAITQCEEMAGRRRKRECEVEGFRCDGTAE